MWLPLFGEMPLLASRIARRGWRFVRFTCGLLLLPPAIASDVSVVLIYYWHPACRQIDTVLRPLVMLVMTCIWLLCLSATSTWLWATTFGEMAGVRASTIDAGVLTAILDDTMKNQKNQKNASELIVSRLQILLAASHQGDEKKLQWDASNTTVMKFEVDLKFSVWSSVMTVFQSLMMFAMSIAICSVKCGTMLLTHPQISTTIFVGSIGILFVM